MTLSVSAYRVVDSSPIGGVCAVVGAYLSVSHFGLEVSSTAFWFGFITSAPLVFIAGAAYWVVGSIMLEKVGLLEVEGSRGGESR